MSQPVKHPALDLGSGLDLRVKSSSPARSLLENLKKKKNLRRKQKKRWSEKGF